LPLNFQRAHLAQRDSLRLANVRGGPSFPGADMGVAILARDDLAGADLSGFGPLDALLPGALTMERAGRQ